MSSRQKGPKSKPNSKPHGYELSTFSRNDIAAFAKSNASQLIKVLSNEIKRFQSTLEKTDICSIKFDIVIQILLKVSHGLTEENSDLCSKAINILGEVFSNRCPIFQNGLKVYVKDTILKSLGKSSFNIEQSIGTLCEFFMCLFNKLPSVCWSILPLDELYQTVETLIEIDHLPNKETLLPKVKELLDLRRMMKNQERVKRIDSKHTPLKKWDNSEYRTVQILPKWEEVSDPKPPYKLRPNIVEGAYEDWMHYYDVQFRLLREDFISPLRKGISDYLEGKKGLNLRNVRVYNNVVIERPVFTKTGLCHEIQFDVSRLKYCNWEHSQRLIFGSLLCLSPDNFKENVFFAVVSKREPRTISRGYLEVMFQGGAELVAYQRLKKKFVMVESLAYYEASKHILKSLQTAEVNTMRFTNYLIYNECEKVSHPEYLDRRSSTYDIQFIIKKETLKAQTQARSYTACVTNSGMFTHVDIMSNAKWPTVEMTQLDESQLLALKKALTQEIAVIQGPPGTGKTYIGLKIVQTLLKNQQAWNSTSTRPNPVHIGQMGNKGRMAHLHTHVSPILIMCFTNHALDQFLEGILDLYDDPNLRLIRIGGRSRNEKIQKYSLYNVKQTLKNVPNSEYAMYKRLLKGADQVGEDCKKKMDSFNMDPDHGFIEQKRIKDVIDEHHYRTLLDQAETEEEFDKALEIWLGLYDKSVIEKFIPREDFQSSEEGSSEDDSSSEEESEEDEPIEGNDDYEDSKNVRVRGEATIEEDSRMIDGMSEMFEELTFEGSSNNAATVKQKKTKFHDIRRTVEIIRPANHKKLRKNGMRSPAMEENEEVNEIEDVHNIDLKDRWRLYKYWHGKYKKCLLNQLEEKCKEYNQACDQANEAHQNTDRYALETAHIIGMTTTGAAKYQHILHLVKPKIVIVEEAAEVLESHIVSALNAATQHLILIGDHKQLRPKPNEYDLVVDYKLDISLFERLVKNNFPHVTLQIQHRMRPEIAELVKPHVYETLENHESVKDYPNIKGISGDIFFIQHHHLEEGSDLSHSNIYEAKYLVALCKYLLQVGYSPSQITILLTYTGQLLKIKKLMPVETFQGVRVSTVDDFQGEENDIILLSLVRSNKEGNIGFLREENRVCVALSRAKHGFYCIGNFEMLRKSSKTDIWERIMSSMEAKGRLGIGLKIHCVNHPSNEYIATTPEVFAKKSPSGGCLLDCRYRLDCGHVCTRKCHTDDREHMKFKCRQRCSRECPEGHRCTKMCCEECQCFTRVKRIIPKCGHLQEMFCFEDPSKFDCRHECSRLCSQGHKCDLLCHQRCICKTRVPKLIEKCGHTQEMFCHEDPRYITCHQRCSRLCSEGHRCTLPCYKKCVCKTKVTKVIPKCEHQQEMDCHQNPSEVKCRHECEKSCSKGHPCPLLCSEQCKPCNVEVETILCCGHKQKVSCSQDLKKLICKMPCGKLCKLGHPCTLNCYQKCVCTTKVERTLKCGHKVMLMCSKDPSQYICTELFQKKLHCGHTANLLCSKDPNDYNCTELCLRELPCGHTANLSCSKDPKHYTCTEPCPKKLACGHKCPAICGRSCIDKQSCFKKVTIKFKDCGHKVETTCGESAKVKCHTKIQVSLPACKHETEISCFERTNLQKIKCKRPCQKKLNCGHICMNRCGDECTKKCQVNMEWTCNQGHKLRKMCHQDFQPCQKKCEKLMSCGHPCTKLCCDDCSSELECQVRTKKTYPCGHQHNVRCSTTPEEQPCDMICRSPLACGHLCRGTCSDCCLTRIHKPCSSSIKLKHFCGELVRMKCLGSTHPLNVDNHSETSRILECRHNKVPYDCNTEYLQCHEPCGWSCPHYKCKKQCHEQCDRPVCNEKCNKKLKCGRHRCVGLCGEPCLSICPECHKDRFMSQLKISKTISPDQCYIQLPCSHIFAVKDLDKYVESLPEYEVSPLQCPECCSPFSCSYRYGNRMKESLLHVDAVRTRLEDLTIQQETSDQKKILLDQLFESTLREFEQNSAVILKNPRGMQWVINYYLASTSSSKFNPEEYLLFYLFAKILKYVLLVGHTHESFQRILNLIGKKISRKETKLSFQILSDLMSEFYRLCVKAKMYAYEQSFVRIVQFHRACATEKAFLEKHESDPKLRIQRADFIRHSQSLDDKLLTKGIRIFEFTNDLVGEIECFHPHILNGSWQRCNGNHYYCVPVCEVGTLRVSCPECTGSYDGSIQANEIEVRKSRHIDIKKQRAEMMAAPLPGKAKKKRSKTKPAGHGTQETRSATTTVAEATAVATAVAAVVAAPIKDQPLTDPKGRKRRKK